jgi:DNA-directed RNA polymerase subunit RPC12/RpoP
MTAPEVFYYCGGCGRYNFYSIPPSSEAGVCVDCGHRDPPRPSERTLAGGPVDRCPQCENPVLYTRKDFPQQLGCAAVTGTILLSSVAYALWDVPAAVAVLALASLADFALYHRLGEVTVCYRCHAELRGFTPNPAHGAFDMHRAEEFEQGK